MRTAGLVLGLFNPLYEIFRPVILIVQAVPVISWLSLVIFAWGIGWKGPVFIAFVSLIPMALLTTVSGVRNLDKNLLEMARVYKIPKKKVLKDIYLGSLIPFIIAIVDVTLGQAWKVILVAEYLSGNTGLGVQILSARYEVNVAKVWALTLFAVVLGFMAERVIKKVFERISKKWVPA
ncbi:MAG: ABC transporter permease subunit [Bacillota bacterium]